MSTKTPGRFLRTNYRLTGGQVDYAALESMLIKFRVTLELESDCGGECTFSMNGYGIPSWVMIRHATHHDAFHSGQFMIGNISVSDASIVYMTMGGGFSMSTVVASGGISHPWTSMQATVSFPFYVMALIASR